MVLWLYLHLHKGLVKRAEGDDRQFEANFQQQQRARLLMTRSRRVERIERFGIFETMQKVAPGRSEAERLPEREYR